ncbi:MAG TPA: hypothetical protein VFG43_08925 [Geminicoccaceae bacterium]|nr:hypothetical protein [Geminicoccaceae bacterium]
MPIARPRRPAFTGAPYEYHRAARRLGAGWRPSEVARLLDCDPATIHLLLRDEEFVRLYRSYLALRQLAPEERLARLARLAVALLEAGEEPEAPPARASAAPRPASDPVDRAARLRGSMVREQAATLEPPPEVEAPVSGNGLPYDRSAGPAARPATTPAEQARPRRLFLKQPPGP